MILYQRIFSIQPNELQKTHIFTLKGSENRCPECEDFHNKSGAGKASAKPHRYKKNMGQEENRFYSLLYGKRTPLPKIDSGIFEGEGLRIGNREKCLLINHVAVDSTQSKQTGNKENFYVGTGVNIGTDKRASLNGNQKGRLIFSPHSFILTKISYLDNLVQNILGCK